MILGLDEQSFEALLYELCNDEEWMFEVKTLRPVSLARRRTKMDPKVESLAKKSGEEVLSGGKQRSLHEIAYKDYMKEFLYNLISELYKPLHDVFCSKRFNRKSLDTALAGTQMAALTQIIVDYLHVPTATALGISAFITLALIRAVQGSFCEFSKNEVLSRLE